MIFCVCIALLFLLSTVVMSLCVVDKFEYCFIWFPTGIVFEYIVVLVGNIDMFYCFVFLMSPIETSFVYAKLGVVLSVVPLLVWRSEFVIVICDIYLFNSFLAAGDR